MRAPQRLLAPRMPSGRLGVEENENSHAFWRKRKDTMFILIGLAAGCQSLKTQRGKKSDRIDGHPPVFGNIFHLFRLKKDASSSLRPGKALAPLIPVSQKINEYPAGYYLYQ